LIVDDDDDDTQEAGTEALDTKSLPEQLESTKTEIQATELNTNARMQLATAKPYRTQKAVMTHFATHTPENATTTGRQSPTISEDLFIKIPSSHRAGSAAEARTTLPTKPIAVAPHLS
jgi:hypothetical protein